MAPITVVNLGSLNIDRVFRVAHIAAPGETIAAESLEVFAGGKGLNQSIALARAGALVCHAGKIGADGGWLLDKLTAEGVDVRGVRVGDAPTGQAIIQVDRAGENSILLWPGANAEITPAEIDAALSDVPRGGWLLVQNETSAVDHAIRRAKQLGLRVALNPAPLDGRVSSYPLELVDLLCVNQIEGGALSGVEAPQDIAGALAERLPRAEVLLTLGAAGALYRCGPQSLSEPAPKVTVCDTTAAGDTFLGYFLASRIAGDDPGRSLARACHAAALAVTRPGASDSIPYAAELGGH